MMEATRQAERAPGALVHAVTDDLAYLRTAIANVYLFGPPGARDGEWVLIDAGVIGSARAIRAAAEERFCAGSRPAAIVLTHGHFDHVGALRELVDEWQVPVYAHELELPYITGRSAYPPPDPSVGGGAMARLAWLYPRGPVDVDGAAGPLPADGSVPGMPGWRWIHTPGHTPGHVSLFRESDGTLLAGDAFTTVRQESFFAVLSQRPEIHGPPMYYTQDWASAAASVRTLAALEPRIVATGHGVPMRGPEMADALRELARDFENLAVPAHGRYVGRPVVADETGVVFVPPPVRDWRTAAYVALGVGAAAGAVALTLRGSRAPATRRMARTRRRR